MTWAVCFILFTFWRYKSRNKKARIHSVDLFINICLCIKKSNWYGLFLGNTSSLCYRFVCGHTSFYVVMDWFFGICVCAYIKLCNIVVEKLGSRSNLRCDRAHFFDMLCASKLKRINTFGHELRLIRFESGIWTADSPKEFQFCFHFVKKSLFFRGNAKENQKKTSSFLLFATKNSHVINWVVIAMCEQSNCVLLAFSHISGDVFFFLRFYVLDIVQAGIILTSI